MTEGVARACRAPGIHSAVNKFQLLLLWTFCHGPSRPPLEALGPVQLPPLRIPPGGSLSSFLVSPVPGPDCFHH